MVMARAKVGIVALGLLLALVAGSFLAGTSRGLAQDDATPEAEAEPGRPAHIHAGSCGEDDLGEIVVPLSNLTPAAGDEVGQENPAGLAETSFTNVPLTLDDILADDHAINIHLSVPEIGTYIACGEIGGVLDPTGSLTIGLREQNGSGFTGIAFLSPADDGASTNVSAFIAGVLDGQAVGGGGDDDADVNVEASPVAAEDATDEAAEADTEEAVTEEEAETVAVSLVEWAIDMPAELAAGPTVFDITNDGTIRHNFEIEGEGLEESLARNLQPGESDTLEVDLAPGTYTVYCPVGNGSHRGEGMELEVTVE